MTRKELKPSIDKLKEANKLDKEYSKYIDVALESLEKGQEIISKKIKEKDE